MLHEDERATMAAKSIGSIAELRCNPPDKDHRTFPPRACDMEAKEELGHIIITLLDNM
jgi:hypothetical protein